MAEQRKKEYENAEARRRRERFAQLKQLAREKTLEASIRRRDQGNDTSETDIWIRWAEEYLGRLDPLSKALPTTEVFEEDLCEVDQHFDYKRVQKAPTQAVPEPVDGR